MARKKDVNIEQNNNVDKDFFGEKKKQKKYISFNTRVTLTSICSVLFIFCSIFLILTSLSVVKLEYINIGERSNIDYKIYLKENEFFQEKYLTKDSSANSYIASLIKDISVNFNYKFEIDKTSSIDISYKVIGILEILNQKDKSILFKEEYTLLEEQTDTIKDYNSYSINEDVLIDYEYYNNRANKFRYNYGVDTDSQLKIYLIVNSKNNESNSFDLNNSSTMSLNIPLSEKTVNINLDYKNLNENKKIVNSRSTKVNERHKFIIGVALGVIGLFSLSYLIKLLLLLVQKKSKYDKYIKKLLREYDRLIINTSSAPKLDGYNVIKINSFQELLDARDNVQGAIKYFVVNEHQKCNFYFTHNDDIYLLVIKAIDME